jgi:hypothetical protein
VYDVRPSIERGVRTVEETEPCFIGHDHNGQALAYVYFENEPGRRSAAKMLTRDEARRNPLGRRFRNLESSLA